MKNKHGHSKLTLERTNFTVPFAVGNDIFSTFTPSFLIRVFFCFCFICMCVCVSSQADFLNLFFFYSFNELNMHPPHWTDFYLIWHNWKISYLYVSLFFSSAVHYMLWWHSTRLTLPQNLLLVVMHQQLTSTHSSVGLIVSRKWHLLQVSSFLLSYPEILLYFLPWVE